jgi:hypothetical protein
MSGNKPYINLCGLYRAIRNKLKAGGKQHRNNKGFNDKEYQTIRKQAENIIEGFNDVDEKYEGGYASYKEVMEDHGIPYNSKKCHMLKEWAKTADTDNTDDIAEYLTITTGEQWATKGFSGYCQGDYCEVVYCTAHYSDEHIKEI